MSGRRTAVSSARYRQVVSALSPSRAQHTPTHTDRTRSQYGKHVRSLSLSLSLGALTQSSRRNGAGQTASASAYHVRLGGTIVSQAKQFPRESTWRSLYVRLRPLEVSPLLVV
jgi:hypothetical protein